MIGDRKHTKLLQIFIGSWTPTITRIIMAISCHAIWFQVRSHKRSETDTHYMGMFVKLLPASIKPSDEWGHTHHKIALELRKPCMSCSAKFFLKYCQHKLRGKKWLLYFLHECMLSHVRPFATPWTVSPQHPLSMALSQQECWSRLPFPPLRNLSDTGIEPTCPGALKLAGRYLTTEPPEKPLLCLIHYILELFVF